MANETQYSASLQASKGGATINKAVSGYLTMSGSHMVQHTQSVGKDSWVAIDVGNLAGVPAKLMIVNLDSTNYVQLAGDDAGAQLQDKILQGDFVLRSPTATIYAKANTAACLVAIVAVDA
jgi:hypothetical protein